LHSSLYFSHRYFNDQELKNTPKTKIESKQNLHTLTLPKTDQPDEGVYKCVATNSDGTIETKAHISICSRFYIIHDFIYSIFPFQQNQKSMVKSTM
jgi:hypothetical protein